MGFTWILMGFYGISMGFHGILMGFTVILIGFYGGYLELCHQLWLLVCYHLGALYL